MSSLRAESVAEVLWELKQLNRVATYGSIASRAGFRPGPQGRFVEQAIQTIRRDWSHLQWWRALPETLVVTRGSDLCDQLQQAGIELKEVRGRKTMLTLANQELLQAWNGVTTVVVEEGTETEAPLNS